ncbi:tripartite tricarboxylate transporter substrate binding protein [Polynucleobacter paneuropaeus]|nr:tripartite tricarboxylate transporter substrate binding protein [Polynucleobacter paneuropaeus]QWD07045.1 tripartite tricarboxylate transporter substrate binding protein [Polynucleobacter paneuropaeus]
MKSINKLNLLILTLLFCTNVFAWPDKTITLVVPFPPGGSTDQMARAIAPKMQNSLGQSVIIDNKPGATGTVGAGFVKRASPDGYTLLVTSLGPLVIVPHLLPSVPYNAATDFDYITVGLQSPNVLVVPANSPYKTLADLIAGEKANPGKLSFGSSGSGSSDHLATEIFWQQTGTSGIHAPYKGGGPAITDTIGGQLDALFANVNSVVQFINTGKLRPLAVAGNKRSPVLPNVPTFSELGYKEVISYGWQAVVAPKGLPIDIKEKIYKSVITAINDPQVKKNFVDVGFEVVANTPEQFVIYQAQENARWNKLIESRQITAN